MKKKPEHERKEVNTLDDLPKIKLSLLIVSLSFELFNKNNNFSPYLQCLLKKSSLKSLNVPLGKVSIESLYVSPISQKKKKNQGSFIWSL
jgi:hypothetical protein